MGLYDSYQLSNSTAIPRYQGSAIPELEQVAQNSQNKYDFAQGQIDLIDEATKHATAAPSDQPVLNDLIQEKRGKLQDYSKRQDLENLWRDTQLQARDFSDRYQPIAQNAKAQGDWFGELQKRQQEGKINAETVKAAQAHVLDNYGGLKYNSDTGKYSNQFQGSQVMNDVDIPKKINEWIAGAHPEVRGGTVKRINGDLYITNGSETKKLDEKEVDGIVAAGMDSDPEVMPWIRQESQLAPYKLGVDKRRPELQQAITQNRFGQLMSDVKNYAKKGIVDEKTFKNEEEYNPLGVERLKKAMADKENQMIPVNFATTTSGNEIKGASEFDDLINKRQQDATGLAQQYQNFISAPGRHFDKATGTLTDADGTDMTIPAQKMYQGLQDHLKETQQLQEIKNRAAKITGYDPTKASKKVLDDADKAGNDAYQNALNNTMSGLTGKDIEAGRTAPGISIDAVNEAKASSQAARDQYIKTHVQGYNEYQKELHDQLQPQGESSKLWGMPNDKMKQELGSVTNALVSKLGLKGGMLSFTTQDGQQLSSDDYDQMAGKIEPIGIMNSAKDGSTQIVFRSNTELENKKLKGQNLIVTMKDPGFIDDYLKHRMSPEDKQQFDTEKELKTGLNNPGAVMDYPIRDGEGHTAGTIRVKRNKGSNQQGSFTVYRPTATGLQQKTFDSYEGVGTELSELQKAYLTPANPKKK